MQKWTVLRSRPQWKQEQFAEAMKGYIPNWASGTATNIRKNLATPDETDLQMVMKAHKNLTDIIEKSNEDNEKGELEDMLKINKSKMTAEERTAYDELIKKKGCRQCKKEC